MAKPNRQTNTETGYKKRLARRASGNPGPNQVWVKRYVPTRSGPVTPNPLGVHRKDDEF